MSGYNLIVRIRALEAKCEELGFLMCHARNYHSEFGDTICVKPRGDSLPIYSRDAELFTGTVESLEVWLRGIEWARKYDSMLLGDRHDQRRLRKEQDYRNDLMLKQIKTGRADGKSSLGSEDC